MPKVEAAFRPILAVEVRQGNTGLLGLVIVIEAQSSGCLADSAFSALCEYDSFGHTGEVVTGMTGKGNIFLGATIGWGTAGLYQTAAKGFCIPLFAAES